VLAKVKQHHEKNRTEGERHPPTSLRQCALLYHLLFPHLLPIPMVVAGRMSSLEKGVQRGKGDYDGDGVVQREWWVLWCSA
jgi:hypothetical protein